MKDIAAFIEGFERFQNRYFREEPELFERLRERQQPTTLVISCCDSRVDPGMLTGADPGDLFVIRNVANLVPPYRHDTEAPGIRSAIEFAVKSLNVKHIIVLGHSKCGGILALMSGVDTDQSEFEFIGSWVGIARPAREKVMRELPDEPFAVQVKACEQAAIELSLANLLSFPWIRERVDDHQLRIHGWYFDLDSGELMERSDVGQPFRPIVAAGKAQQAVIVFD